MSKSDERRKHRRVDADFAVKLGGKSAITSPLTGLNISMGGVYCSVANFVPLMTKLETTLMLPQGDGEERVLDAEMIVVWSDPEVEIPGCESYEIGCAFLPLTDKKKQLLTRYIEQVGSVSTDLPS